MVVQGDNNFGHSLPGQTIQNKLRGIICQQSQAFWGLLINWDIFYNLLYMSLFKAEMAIYLNNLIF